MIKAVIVIILTADVMNHGPSAVEYTNWEFACYNFRGNAP